MTAIESMMNPNVVTVAAEQTVQEAAELMRARNLGALVVTKEGAICGIFSERDLLNRVVAERKDPASTKVESVSTPTPVTVTEDETVENCYRLIRDKGFRHLPVRNAANQPVGIVSSRDFLRCLMVQVERDVSLEDTCAKLGQLTQLFNSMEELR